MKGTVKKINNSIVRLTMLFSVFLAILTVLTLFDSLHRLVELFTHFKLQYLIASFLFTSIFIVAKKYLLSLGMCVVLLINGFQIFPWYLGKPINNKNGYAGKLKVIHANVLTSNKNYHSLNQLVIEEKPDILITQEVNRRWLQALSGTEQLLPYKITQAREDNFGIAVYSKIPFKSAEVIYLASSTIPSIKIEFILSEQNISLITTHPLPPINKNYFDSRNRQIAAAALMATNEKTPVVLIGDFNITMWSSDYSSLEGTSKLKNTRRGFGVLPTWPSKLFPFMIPIDHCFVSSEFDVINMKVGKNIGSDHLPIIVTLGLNSTDTVEKFK